MLYLFFQSEQTARMPPSTEAADANTDRGHLTPSITPAHSTDPSLQSFSNNNNTTNNNTRNRTQSTHLCNSFYKVSEKRTARNLLQLGENLINTTHSTKSGTNQISENKSTNRKYSRNVENQRHMSILDNNSSIRCSNSAGLRAYHNGTGTVVLRTCLTALVVLACLLEGGVKGAPNPLLVPRHSTPHKSFFESSRRSESIYMIITYGHSSYSYNLMMQIITDN